MMLLAHMLNVFRSPIRVISHLVDERDSLLVGVHAVDCLSVKRTFFNLRISVSRDIMNESSRIRVIIDDYLCAPCASVGTVYV